MIRIARVIATGFSGFQVVAYSRIAWADGGCKNCLEGGGCFWVCTVVYGVIAIPVWLILVAGLLVGEPRLRRVLPHLISLPLAYIGTGIAMGSSSLPTWARIAVTVLPLIGWYLALLRVAALRILLHSPRRES